MDSSSSWLETFQASLTAIFHAAAERAPGIIAAILVLVLGWFIARFARILVRRVVRASSRLLQSVLPRSAAAAVGVPPGLTNLIGHTAFAAVFLVALTVAMDLAGFEAAMGWLASLAAYLPHIVAGFVIIIVGYLLGVFARDQVKLWLPDDVSTPGLALPRLAQYSVAGIALIVGLDQMGVDVRFLIALFVVLASAICIGFALAFATGARAHVSNLIGTRAASRTVATGTVVRIDGVEGVVLEITNSHIALDTGDGKVYVPGRLVDEQTFTVRPSARAGGGRNG